MAALFHSFPITGAEIVSVLGRLFSPSQRWILLDIETLCEGDDCSALGDLWQRVQIDPIELTTRELSDALYHAYQIITLDIHIEGEPLKQLYIEDGVEYDCSLI